MSEALVNNLRSPYIKREWIIDAADLIEKQTSEIARLRREKAELVEAASVLCDEMEANDEHGGGADDPSCPLCRAIKVIRSAIESKPASLDPAVLVDLLRLHRCNSDGRQSVGECVDQGQCGCSCGLLLRSATETPADEDDGGGDPSETALLKPRGNNGVVSADICYDALLLLGDRGITEKHIAGWTQEERDAAYDWAIRVHLIAGDNDGVFLPERPACVRSAAEKGEPT